jgi:hypothetical protein
MPWTAPPVEEASHVEALAAEWIAPYHQAEHLVRARDWLVHLTPSATAEMRIAAITHDIERMFPGGPVLGHADVRWDDPAYLFPHSLRSAEVVSVWLGNLGPVAATVDVAGLNGADDVQAADSLSFLETLAGVTRDWVLSGTCSRVQAQRKLQYMVDRVRLPAAIRLAGPLLEWAIDQLPAGVATTEGAGR